MTRSERMELCDFVVHVEPPDLLPGNALIMRRNSTVEHVVSFSHFTDMAATSISTFTVIINTNSIDLICTSSVSWHPQNSHGPIQVCFSLGKPFSTTE